MNSITKEDLGNVKSNETNASSEPTVFPSRLRQHMDEVQMPVKELAEKMFLTPSAITAYRQGDRSPDLEKFTRLVQTLNVSADYLIGESDVPHPSREGLTAKEYKLMTAFRNLSAFNQDCAIELLCNLDENAK